jgi:16S rRNA (cytosine967-C5)-methyltransferase
MGDEGRVVAVDSDARRARAISENCERLGIRSVEVRVGDARRAQHGDGYDRVLVDPPCSDLGTLQARPDVRWRKSPDVVAELCALQQEILDAAAVAVRPEGRLVYSTCTIDVAENERQIADFLARHPSFSAVDLPGPYPRRLDSGATRLVQTLPHQDKTDGFFIAALTRNA